MEVKSGSGYLDRTVEIGVGSDNQYPNCRLAIGAVSLFSIVGNGVLFLQSSMNWILTSIFLKAEETWNMKKSSLISCLSCISGLKAFNICGMHSFWDTSRILITGITSIHGWPIYERLKSVVCPDRLFGIRPPSSRIPKGRNIASVCMADREELKRLRDAFQPTHVLHAAGVCDLDICEAKPRYAYDINVHGARNIASVFSQSCYIMFLSADLVFSGNNPSALGYAEKDEPDPVSVVGKTFVLAEKEIAKSARHAIVRLGLPMGGSIQGKKGAIDFIERRLRRGLPMSLFHDEYRSCIHCDDLADAVASLFSLEAEGLFHIGGPQPLSLYEIGERILKRGRYCGEALIKWSRADDVNGPPRIGNVHLNSGKVERLLGRTMRQWEY
jgi:dTDP-4-dehydrorhamnose reductase